MSYSDFIFYSCSFLVSFDCMMVIYARCSWELVWHLAWGLRIVLERGHRWSASWSYFFFVSATVCMSPAIILGKWVSRSGAFWSYVFVAVTQHGFFCSFIVVYFGHIVVCLRWLAWSLVWSWFISYGFIIHCLGIIFVDLFVYAMVV